MKCLRIFATPDGESHFDEIELPTTRPVHPDAVPFEVSASYPASRVRIARIPAGMREVAWHTVPDPTLTVRLDGSVEYQTSDGEMRHVQAGSFVLVEDTHGKAICHAIPRRRRPSSGSHSRTASIGRPRSSFWHAVGTVAEDLIEPGGIGFDENPTQASGAGRP